MVASPVKPRAIAQTSASDVSQLRATFEALDASSCPYQYNFHMHTVHSDGQLTSDALVEQVIHLGLKAFAITDHHTVEGYLNAKQCIEDWQWRHPSTVLVGKGRTAVGGRSGLPRLWTGVEITSRLAETDVHILGYGFDIEHSAMTDYIGGSSPRGSAQLAENVIHAIQSAGGLAVLAHPARYRRPAEELVNEAVKRGIDGIETYYAYDNPSEWRPCPKKTPLLQSLAETHQLLSTCGTDTHGKVLTRRL
ncbi:MAG: PHP domain-containing protein [Leptolyngbyaceae cyanobacterium T60_A2020_046]|nr:PHP domain-containing protein [Leptolyngbyaceae cyanobacterium T60_A2020_046]